MISIEPLWPASETVIVVVPSATGLTPDLFQITPTFVLDEVQTALLLTACEEPSGKPKRASSDIALELAGAVVLLPLMVRELGVLTDRIAEAECPWYVAVMLVMPSFVPEVARPT